MALSLASLTNNQMSGLTGRKIRYPYNEAVLSEIAAFREAAATNMANAYREKALTQDKAQAEATLALQKETAATQASQAQKASAIQAGGIGVSLANMTKDAWYPKVKEIIAGKNAATSAATEADKVTAHGQEYADPEDVNKDVSVGKEEANASGGEGGGNAGGTGEDAGVTQKNALQDVPEDPGLSNASLQSDSARRKSALDAMDEINGGGEGGGGNAGGTGEDAGATQKNALQDVPEDQGRSNIPIEEEEEELLNSSLTGEEDAALDATLSGGEDAALDAAGEASLEDLTTGAMSGDIAASSSLSSLSSVFSIPALAADITSYLTGNPTKSVFGAEGPFRSAYMNTDVITKPIQNTINQIGETASSLWDSITSGGK